jgi:hypothetical protein
MDTDEIVIGHEQRDGMSVVLDLFKAVSLAFPIPLLGLFLLEIIRRSTGCGGSRRAAAIASLAYDFGDFSVEHRYQHGKEAARERAIRLGAPR